MREKIRLTHETVLSIIIILMLLVSAACDKPASDKDSTLIIYLGVKASTSEDLDKVNALLDAYVWEKLGFHARLHMPLNRSQTLLATVQAGDQVDIAYSFALSGIYQMVESGYLYPLDELLKEYGQGILDAIDPDYYEFSRLNGSLYAMPTNRDRHMIFGFEYNQEIAEQYDLDLSDVNTPEDLSAIFEILRKRAPNIASTVVVPSVMRYEQVDFLGNGYGVLTQDSGAAVVNLYETEEFYERVKLFHYWRQQGYLLDYTQDAGSVVFYLSSGLVFGCLTYGKVGFEAQESKLCGRKIGFQPLSSPYRTSDNQNLAWYIIPSTSKNPEQAMQLLNLMYTDKYIANLIMYGVEGVHYERDGVNPGILHYADDQTSSGYYGPIGWSYCNQYVADIWEGNDTAVWEQTEAINHAAVRSYAWGFQFDSSSVSEQIYNCDSVRDKYLLSLYAGISDPEETVAAFLQDLKYAGIDEIIAEKQRQLDIFLQKFK